MAEKPRALFLGPEAPYPPVGGGAIRAASLLEYLSRRYVVDAVVFRQPGAPDPAGLIPPAIAREVHVLDLPYHSRRFLPRLGRNLSRVLRSMPPLNDRFRGFGEPIHRFLEGRHYDLGIVEHFWCAPYWEQVAPRCERVILDLHNIESELLAGCAKAEGWPKDQAFRRFHAGCRKMERRWLPRYTLLLAVSEQDAQRLCTIAPGCRCEVYPNTLPYLAEPSREEDDAIVFSGDLLYHPNLMAVRHFRQRIWPALRGRWPSLVWRLIGRNPDAVAKHVGGDPRIELIGPVDDAISVLARAKVAVVPVLAGSGTRVKILEAWAAARAVVSTTIGAEGLPGRHGEHLLLADDPRLFADTVSSLLQSKEMRKTVGRGGRKLYEAEFTWESAWKKLDQLRI